MTAPGPQPRHPCQTGESRPGAASTDDHRYDRTSSVAYSQVCALRLHEGKDQAHPFLRILGVSRINPPRLIHTKTGEVPKSTSDALVGLEIQPHRPVDEP